MITKTKAARNDRALVFRPTLNRQLVVEDYLIRSRTGRLWSDNPFIFLLSYVLFKPIKFYINLEEFMAQFPPAMWLTWSHVKVARHPICF